MKFNYKDKPFEERKNEFLKIKNKHPLHTPIIVNTQIKTKKNKFIVPSDSSLSNFKAMFRVYVNLKPEEAIFILINNTMVPGTNLISSIYQKHKDRDGFLYLDIFKENTFG